MGALLGVAGGSLGAAALGYYGQQQTNAMNQNMLSQQENFEERMSDTAHTREVADLRNAGLNPILSAGGGGASTPQVSPPSMTSPLTPAATALQGMSSSVLGAAKTLQDLKVANAQTKNLEASARLADANATVASKTAGEKSIFSSVSNDADSIYKVMHDKVANFLTRLGYTQSNAKDQNWFFGSPNIQPSQPTLQIAPGGAQ